MEIAEGIEVTDAEGAAKLAAAVNDRAIDLLINNAGVLIADQLNRVDFEDVTKQFEINALGPLRVTFALSSHLKRGSKVGLITSRMGSIDDNSSGGYYGYQNEQGRAQHGREVS